MRKTIVGLVTAGAAAAIGSVGAPAANAVPWCAPVVLSSGVNYTEPGVDVDPRPGSNLVYVNAIPGIPNFSAVWSSTTPCTPGSPSWTSVNPLTSGRATCPGGGDSDVAVQSDGTLSFTDLYLVSACVASSPAASPLTAGGKVWVGQPFSLPVIDRQWLAAADKITYFVTHQLEGGLLVAKSYDGGVTYPVASVAATVADQLDCLCPPGNIVAEHGTGTGDVTGLYDKVGVIYSTGTGVNFARSDDGGTVFLKKVIDPSGGGNTSSIFPVVASGGGGVLHAVWAETTGSSSNIRYSLSTNFGNTWTAPSTIVSGGSNVFPWVAAKGSKVSLAFYRTTTTGNPNSVGAGASWFLKYLEGTYSGGATAWSNTLESPDPAAVKTGPICTQGLSCSGGRELGDFLQVAIRNNGTPIISYIQATGPRQVRVVSG